MAKFPEPKVMTGVRSWFGLTNQVNCFHDDWSIMDPLRTLLKPAKTGEKWADRWGQEQRTAFEISRTKIAEKIKAGIYAFTPGLTTALGTNWSPIGLGFHMMQNHCKCNSRVPSGCKDGWRTVPTGSKFMTGAESRCAPGEGEALAAAWALGKTHHITLGNNKLIVQVDHKPLLKILGNRELEDIENPRILNLKQKTLQWRFSVEHVPGKDHHVADAMSRFPREKPEGDKLWKPW